MSVEHDSPLPDLIALCAELVAVSARYNGIGDAYEWDDYPPPIKKELLDLVRLSHKLAETIAAIPAFTEREIGAKAAACWAHANLVPGNRRHDDVLWAFHTVQDVVRMLPSH
jgi:hypothetical protein